MEPLLASDASISTSLNLALDQLMSNIRLLETSLELKTKDEMIKREDRII
ncbi:hypothetical protein E1A91_D06G128000v1 [Gossypium mustelinum]|uniref:Uncharacterized protein n=1 Tax=Gossypium mustelinum TaxID=34275 RepID=A0A5D2UKR5_GOSMU|nr:hypothetical protein E1A91_D06G128000v1 [Gossypium mustelinum]